MSQAARRIRGLNQDNRQGLSGERPDADRDRARRTEASGRGLSIEGCNRPGMPQHIQVRVYGLGAWTC